MSYVAPVKAFAHLDRIVGWQQGQKPAPVTVEIDLSNRCYLGCQSCHFAHTHSRGPWVSKARRLPMAWEGSGDLADRTMIDRALVEMQQVGVKGLVWSGGGEPTLHPDWLEIVTLARSLGFEQGMYTAGGLLTESSATILAQSAAWVVVSLDCADAATYAAEKRVAPAYFDQACRGIRALASARAAVVGVSFLLHAENWNTADAMLVLARSLGATYTTFRPTIETSPEAPATVTGDRAWITAALPTLQALAAEPDVECDPARFLAYRDWAGRSYDTCHGIKLHATITPDGKVWEIGRAHV